MATLISGETFQREYRASATAVTTRFAGPKASESPAVLTGGVWKVSVQTAGWPPGLYWYDVIGSDVSGKIWVITRERLELKPSLSDIADDSRTQAERMVEMIEAQMSGNASAGVRRYKINNRELERYSIEELMQLLRYWQGVVSDERRAAAGKPKFGTSMRFYFPD